ncbi:MAG: aminotransferase class I/II-fold pyridoxal phosphate-dependent enzyme [Solirubrobacteraceae bacterium]
MPVTTQGAFYVYARSDRFASDRTEFVDRLLNDAGVAAVPGNDFGVFEAQQHIRLSYTTSMNQPHEALSRLDAFLGH